MKLDVSGVTTASPQSHAHLLLKSSAVDLVSHLPYNSCLLMFHIIDANSRNERKFCCLWKQATNCT